MLICKNIFFPVFFYLIVRFFPCLCFLTICTFLFSLKCIYLSLYVLNNRPFHHLKKSQWLRKGLGEYVTTVFTFKNFINRCVMFLELNKIRLMVVTPVLYMCLCVGMCTCNGCSLWISFYITNL